MKAYLIQQSYILGIFNIILPNQNSIIMKRHIRTLCCALAITMQANAQLVFTGFDLNPGAGDSSPWQFVNYNGKMLFNAATTASGAELWISDGTSAGTQLLKEIYTGSTGSSPYNFFEVNGKLLFAAISNGNGQELWITDGTAAGTQQLKDINPGAGSSGALTNAIVMNNKLYFAANDGTHGTELWVSDGTSAGTQLLKDINPGAPNANPYKPVIYNGKIYFAAADAANGEELWVTDGTSAGTQMVRDIATGFVGSSPGSLTIYNGLLYFFASTTTYGRELWVTDGTSANTQVIKDLNPGAGAGAYTYPYTAVYGGKLYFAGDNGTSGTELFATDGTTAGTVLVSNINSSGSSLPADFYIYKNKLYFNADDGTNGRELWVTDGSNTTMLADLNPGAGNGSPSGFYNYKGNLYFGATRSSAPDYNFYKSDGTAAGTVLIAPTIAPNINPVADAVGFFLNTTNNTLYVRANYNSNGLEMWAIKDTSTTSITSATTVADARIYPNPAHNSFTIKTTTAFTTGNVTLTDVTGRVVKTEKLYSNEQTISLQGIAPGMYMADVRLDDKRTTQKLMIQ